MVVGTLVVVGPLVGIIKAVPLVVIELFVVIVKVEEFDIVDTL